MQPPTMADKPYNPITKNPQGNCKYAVKYTAAMIQK